MPFFPLALCFTTFFTWACTEIKIVDEKVTYIFIFQFFLHLSFFSFSYLFAAVIDLLLGLLLVQKILRKHRQDRKILPWCSHWQFCSEFFSQISEHFHAYFRLQWADHSDLGIIGKIFFSCSRTWVQMMPILVKCYDLRSGTKANACHSRNRSQLV